MAEVARNIARLDAELLRSAMQLVQRQPLRARRARRPRAGDGSEARACGGDRQAGAELFDFVVLDVGRSMDAVSLQALDLADRIFPVAAAHPALVRDARRLRDLFRSLEYPASKIHWLVNRHQKGGDITIEALEATLGSKVIKAVPNHYEAVNASVNEGVPIAQAGAQQPGNRALQDIAAASRRRRQDKQESAGSAFSAAARERHHAATLRRDTMNLLRERLTARGDAREPSPQPTSRRRAPRTPTRR